MQPPKGQRTRPSVDRQKTSQSFSDALPPTSKTVTPYPTEQNRNTWQTTLAPDLLQRETEAGKIAVVPDNARSHHARALTGLHGPGRLLERITPIHPPPYAPDHNPAEHVRNTARNNTATIQRETPEETLGASAPHVTSRTFDHGSDPLPAKPETILFHDGHNVGSAESLGLVPSDDLLTAAAEPVAWHDVVERQKHCRAGHLCPVVENRVDLRREDLTVPFVLAHEEILNLIGEHLYIEAAPYHDQRAGQLTAQPREVTVPLSV